MVPNESPTRRTAAAGSARAELGGVIIGGLAAVVNNKSQLDRIQQYLDDAKAKLPSFQQARNSIPGK